MKVALVDNSASALQEAQKAVLREAVTGGEAAMVKTYRVDVTDIEQWKDLKAMVEMDFGLVSLLMLNAGVSKTSGWENDENFRTVR